jgi:hypothetical protein
MALEPDAQVAAEAPATLEVRDEGDHYRVHIGSVERQVEDAARRCEDRARVAAVIATLALATEASPPSPSPSPSPLPSPQSIPPRPPSPPPRRSVHITLELAGIAAVAAQTGPPANGGARARVVVGGRYLSGTLGVAGLSPATLPLAGGFRSSLQRVPIELGLRAGGERGRFGAFGELGLVLAPTVVDGFGLDQARAQTFVDIGLRAAVPFAISLGRRVALLIAPALEVSLHPAELAILPHGVVGETPRLWLSLDVGAKVTLR